MGERKFTLVCLMVISLVFTTKVWGDDFKPGSELEGFRGIKWGADISTLKDMKFIGCDIGYEKYYRNGDLLRIGSAKLEKIEYRFYNGKLVCIHIIAEGRTNFNNLIKATFMAFGITDVDFIKPKNELIIEKYEWDGNITKINLSFAWNAGFLYLWSSKHLKEQESKLKIKE